MSSVRDSDRIIGLLDSKTEKAERGERIDKHLLITRYHAARAARGEMLSIDDVLEILSIPLIGIVPESEEVLRASNVGSPVTLNNPLSAPARAYFEATRRLKGEQIPMLVPNEGQRHFQQAVRTEGSMNLFGLFRRGSAPIARERLQILLAHERIARSQPDLLGVLREEILAVISRHVAFEPEQGADQDGSRQIGIDACSRYRDSERSPDVRRVPAYRQPAHWSGCEAACQEWTRE